MALVQRLLTVTFTQANGTFQKSGQNTTTLSKLRMKAKIVKAGGTSMGTAQLEIYGITRSDMNALSTLGMQYILTGRNTVSVQAGDVNGMTQVFSGGITNAWADFQSSPDVVFHVSAQAGLAASVETGPPSSYKGPVDVATVMGNLAGKAGLTLENNGVKTKLPTSYFYGSLRNQIVKCAENAGIGHYIDDDKLAIWPANGNRQGDTPLISPSTGMVGYPAYVVQGIMLKTIFNPAIKFMGQVEVKGSILTPANSVWNVYSLGHDLNSMVVGGDWFSNIGGYNPNMPRPVTQ